MLMVSELWYLEFRKGLLTLDFFYFLKLAEDNLYQSILHRVINSNPTKVIPGKITRLLPSSAVAAIFFSDHCADH